MSTRDLEAQRLKKDWNENPRWNGVKRGYTAEDVVRLRGIRARGLAGNDDGTPGRPTLKRRQPTPDDATTAPDGTQKPEANKPAPPTLRREGQPQPSATPQP